MDFPRSLGVTPKKASLTWVAFLGALVVALFFLVGCSSEDKPTPTPAPTSVTEPQVAEVQVQAATGGTVDSGDGVLTLEVPPGALGQDTQIKVTTVSKDQLHEDLRELAGDGPAYRLEPDGLVFSQPVPISVRVPREALPADLAEGSIVEFTLITRSRDGLVEVLDDVELETQADGSIVARAKVSHFSDVAATSPAEVPLLGIHIDPIDFGDVLLGTEVIKQTAILINTGDEKTGFVPPNSLTYSAKGVPPDFLAFVVANPTFTEPLRTGFANPTGYTIAPIKFTPLRRGKHTGVLEAISGIPDPVADRLVGEGILPIGRRSLFSKSVELTGNGLAPVAWQDGQASPSIEFGEACVGGSIVRTAVLVNTGDFPDAEISVLGPSAPFSSATPGALTQDVRFPPTAARTFESALVARSTFTYRGETVTRDFRLDLKGRGVLCRIEFDPSEGVRVGDDVRVLVTGPDNTSFTLLITGPGTPSTTELMTGRFTSFVEDSFTPDAAGTWFFRAPFSALGEATGTLEVAGEARPALAVDTIDFGDVLVGNQESRTVSVTNTGDAAVDLVTYAVRGTGFSPRIANLGSIPAGGSASATVNFEPPARGEFPGLIDVEGNAGSKAVRAQAVVRGTGVASDLTFTPNPVAFGEVCVDQTETISVDMQNVGDFDLTQVTLAGLDAPFGISSVPGALPLNMGQLFRVTASFAPSEEGSFEDSLVATAQFNYRGAPVSPPPIFALSLTGEGVQCASRPAIEIVDSASFGRVLVDTQESQTIVVTNTGNVLLENVTYSVTPRFGAAFSPQNVVSLGDIPPGGTASAVVTFNPTERQRYEGIFVVTADAEGATAGSLGAQATVTGTGVDAQLTFDPDPVEFGNVIVNSSKTAQATATNTGDFNLTITEVSDPGDPFFVGTIPGSLPLGQNESFSLDLLFSPTVVGAQGGAVNVTASFEHPPGQPRMKSFTLPLTGIGVAPLSVGITPPTGLKVGDSPMVTFTGPASQPFTETRCDPIDDCQSFSRTFGADGTFENMPTLGQVGTWTITSTLSDGQTASATTAVAARPTATSSFATACTGFSSAPAGDSPGMGVDVPGPGMWRVTSVTVNIFDNPQPFDLVIFDGAGTVLETFPVSQESQQLGLNVITVQSSSIFSAGGMAGESDFIVGVRFQTPDGPVLCRDDAPTTTGGMAYLIGATGTVTPWSVKGPQFGLPPDGVFDIAVIIEDP